MTELNIETIGRTRLTDTVKEQLARLLIDQSLPPGHVLPSEAELASRFGVSKPVIREALRGLAAFGMIEIQQGKAATVGAPSAEPLQQFLRFAIQSTGQGIREAIELRRVIEAGTVVLAAQRITDADIVELEATIARQKEALGTVDPWVDADLEFHMLVARIARNTLMLYLMQALANPIRETMRMMHIQRGPQYAEPAFGRHVNIFLALKARNVQASKEAMQIHFDATEATVLNIMKSKTTG